MIRPLLILALLGVSSMAVDSDAFELARSAFSGGAYSAVGLNGRLAGSVGEAGVVGRAVGEGRVATFGFWAGRFQMSTSSLETPGGTPAATFTNTLGAASPNPFRLDTVLAYAIAERGPVLWSVYDLSGRRVAGEAVREHPNGKFSLRWDGRDGFGTELPNGLYFVRMESGTWSSTRKVVKLR